jgi:predicted DNA-binding protein
VSDEPKARTFQITVPLSQSMHERLVELAHDAGVDGIDFVRELIDVAIADRNAKRRIA